MNDNERNIIEMGEIKVFQQMDLKFNPYNLGRNQQFLMTSREKDNEFLLLNFMKRTRT